MIRKYLNYRNDIPAFYETKVKSQIRDIEKLIKFKTLKISRIELKSYFNKRKGTIQNWVKAEASL